MADQAAKLRKMRGVTKASITSFVKKIEEIWANDVPNLDDLEEHLAQLEQKGIELKHLDNEILSLIDDLNEIEKDAKSSSEYYDKITVWKFRINKKLKQINANETTQITQVINNKPVDIPSTVKLPTLKIEKYFGDVTLFQNFWNSFKIAIHDNESLSNIEKMTYLQSYLGGNAYNSISGFALSDKNYVEAVDILKQQFGRKDLIITSHINNLLALKPICKTNDVVSLRKLYDFIQIQIRSLKSLDIQSNSFDALLIPIILKSLPSNLSLEFNKQCLKINNSSSYSNIDELLAFILLEIEAREKQRQINSFSDCTMTIHRQPVADRKSFSEVSHISLKDKSLFCLFCENADHVTEKCKSISIEEKLKKLKAEGRCYLCLKKNKHLAKDCRSKLKCSFCGRGHNVTICKKLFGNESDKSNNDINEGNKNNALIARVTSNNLFNIEKPQKEKTLFEKLPTVEIECDGKILNAILDSGTELTIIKSTCVPEYFKNPCGSVILQSAFGHQLRAPLINIPLSKAADNLNYKVFPKVMITCAMVDNLVNDLLLSLNTYKELQNLNESENNAMSTLVECDIDKISEINIVTLPDQNKFSQTFNENIEVNLTCSTPDIEAPNTSTNIDHVCPSDNSDNFMNDSDKFKFQQKNDSSLNQCWLDAKKKSNNYFVNDGLLYHRDKMLGETVHQLLVPEPRRNQLLELAHSSPWGGHLRKKKTTQRLKYSFYWPTIKNDVSEFCEKCLSCQLRAKPNKFDTVPITPVTRPDEAMQIINVDIIGPIEPNSAGYKYVLCAIDQCTRWPEAVCLKNISAKSTCDALLEIFSRTGIPKLIASDQGSNFTSALTNEFMKRLGTAPRFSVPGYAQSNGLVERWNSVLKGMIHHTIREHSKNWHKHIPFLLWAYREVPNATTDVSPFQMLYGRRPTGPLSILKSTWTNETPLPCGQLGSVTNYLNDLKVKLEKAAEHAEISCSKTQPAYAFYHNRKTRHKEFKVNDQVIVLVPDSNHKMYARWTAPAIIIQKKSPYSYLVQLPDNSVKHLHANKIRELKAQTSHIGVIYDADIDFGEVENVPQITKKDFNETYIELQLSHLSPDKKDQLINILRKHSNIQSGIPTIANVGEHCIKLKPNSQPKCQKPYRIPEALKNEVDRQIEELLSLGLIEHSESEYAHPVVCVAKKDSSVRLCVDYRYLNSQTEIDSFPMTNATDLIYKVAPAKFISLLDLLKGYWQIRLNKDCRHLTSFVTHRGQYSFIVMPFGLRNAAATFQRSMNRILNQHRSYAETYIDDVVIFSDNWNDHIKHLDAVLSTLEKVNFTVNFKKCAFAQPRIKFLGHVVGSGIHAPDPDKVKAIQNLEIPKSKKDVKSILGLLSYYRSYVPSFSDIAHPLIELTKKRAPNEISWSDHCNKAFTELKNAISNSPNCYSPNFQKPFIIYTDASSYAIGACLSQKDELDQEHPIAFISKKLSKCQEGYATIEKEAYAVIFALKKFEHYIYNTQVTVVSDHNPLTFLTDCASQSARLQRWALALQRFQAQISYRSGKSHINADSLSRLHATHWT